MDQPTLSTANGEVKLADFDLDAWIDGTTGITGLARIVQRGDLLAVRDRLEHDLAVTKKVPDADRGINERSPKQIEAELEQVYEQLWDSMLWVHVQDRTEDRRNALREQLKNDGVPDDHIPYYVVADAIIKVETADGRSITLGEDGFGGKRLIAIRDNAGDAALIDLNRVFVEVTARAPAVQAPLSRAASSTQGGSTSRSQSGRRGSGGSRRS